MASAVASASSSSKFEWPWQYSFQPFFTLQPHAETRRRQLDAWCALVLDYCRDRRLFVLNVEEMLSAGHELFSNKSIDRRLARDALLSVLDELRRRGQLEWLDDAGSASPARHKTEPLDPNRRLGKCRIVWRSVEEWAALIARYAESRALAGTVCTIYELLEGDRTAEQPFHQIDQDLFVRAIRVLESQGRAALFADDDSGATGVKFL